MSRHINTPTRVFAFSAKPLQSPMTRFRGKRTHSIITAKESNQAAHTGTVSSKTCQGFSPYSLVQQRTRMRVHPLSRVRVAHLPQKPDQYSIFASWTSTTMRGTPRIDNLCIQKRYHAVVKQHEGPWPFGKIFAADHLNRHYISRRVYSKQA